MGYFISINLIPSDILDYVANKIDVSYDHFDFETYDKSMIKRYHLQLIRDFINIKSYDKYAQAVTFKSAAEAAKIKDNDADIINVVIEELIKQRYELPAFSTLARIARKVRYDICKSYYRSVYKNLNPQTIDTINKIFESDENSTYTSWNLLKQETGKLSTKNLKEIITHLEKIKNIQIDSSALSIIPDIKIKHFASEAKTLDAAKIKEVEPYKRYTLAASFLKQKHSTILDDMGEMFIKLVKSSQNRAKDMLNQYKLNNSQTTDNLIETLRNFIIAFKSEGSQEDRFKAIETLMETENTDDILEKCEKHNTYSGNNYYPFAWQCLKGSRSTLFKLLDLVELNSTTQNKSIEIALTIIKKYKASNRTDFITVTNEDFEDIDFSWITDQWWKLLTGYTNRNDYPEKINRRNFEACVFYQIMCDLKSGDLCIKNSDIYSDYREQLISWEEYEKNIDLFGEQVNLPITGKEFVEFVKKKLTEEARKADESFPNNQYLKIVNGEPTLSKIKKKKDPKDLKLIESLISENLQPVNIFDILSDTEQWLNWTRHFGSISGLDSKIENSVDRYIVTSFCYGCNLGPTQTARSLEEINRKQVAWVNQRHVKEEKLDEANKHIINEYNRFKLPKYWGTGESASADGTKWDLYEKNLLSEYHIRYGGYGGIGYYHVSDLYIALFSNFIPCGVWEGVYILDENIKNESDIRPDTYHADTQGQNTTIFGLESLLGIKLMPRIRNWKHLTFYKPDKNTTYKNIDEIFSDNIDWKLIETYLPDMLRVVLSIKMGKLTPSTILKKLSSYSKKNKLYQAFRELGNVERTCFLLKYISDPEVRTTIQEATNKSESFNGFVKWVSFGGEGVISHNDRDEQRKIIKYNHLVANCIIFYNVYNMSLVLQNLIMEGYKIDDTILRSLSPYITSHINRFGKYTIDKGRIAPILDFEMTAL